MKNQIIIHGSGKQTRIALLENGELAQLFIEAPENQRTVGDIYIAEVHKVMAGIRAAFISMGTPKDAFLHFSDVGENLESYINKLNGPDAVDKAIAFNKELNKRFANNKPSTEHVSIGIEKQMRAGDVLQSGQKLLVQIVKEPIGSKGPRVSTDITIAGRFVVLIPQGDYVAVSKRIRSFKERRRLRNIVSSKMPDGFGIIVRTVAQNQPDDVLIEDVQDVLAKWQKIVSQIKTAKPPQLLYRDLDMTESLIRDLFAKDYNQVLIDDPDIYKEVKNSVSRWAPEMVPNIKLYKGKEHIFDSLHIAADVESIFSPRVKMPSGGYLIFEQTEAMYVVDVNSGRYAAKRNQEENSLKTNLEAAREIAKQLRLRDIGGIIVVDFIDLKDDVNRKKVYDELKKEFRKDKAKTNVLQMSDFGLIQITRQRIRPSVVTSISKVCPMCGGTGEMVSQNTVLADIEAWLSKYRHSYKKRSVDLYLNPFLSSFITRGLISQRLKWIFKFGMNISVFNDDIQSMNDYRFALPGTDVDITEAVMQDRDLESARRESEEELLKMTSESKVDRSKLDVFDKKSDLKTDTKRKNAYYDEEWATDEDEEERDETASDSKKTGKPHKTISLKPKSSSNQGTSGQAYEKEFVSKAELYANLKQALDVAKEYALAHNIEVKLVEQEEIEEEVFDDELSEYSKEIELNIQTDEDEEDSTDDEDFDDDDSDDEDSDDEDSDDEDSEDEDSDDEDSEDEDSEDEDSEDEDSEDDQVDSSEISKPEAVSVKSSIQFVETESDDSVELEIYKETVEVIEETVPETSETSSNEDKNEETTEVEETSPKIPTDETDEGEPSETVKKKRGRKAIMVTRKTSVEKDSPKKIIQSTVKARKKAQEELSEANDNEAVAALDQTESETEKAPAKKEKTTKTKKSPAKTSKAKATAKTKKTADADSEEKAGINLISSIVADVVKEKEKPKIRVSTTKSGKGKKTEDDSEVSE